MKPLTAITNREPVTPEITIGTAERRWSRGEMWSQP